MDYERLPKQAGMRKGCAARNKPTVNTGINVGAGRTMVCQVSARGLRNQKKKRG